MNMGEFYLSELMEKIAGYYREKLALIKTDLMIGEYKNCLLSGDLSRSVEVLQNVMENALKYGDGKQVELIFPEDDECVQIAVRNGGCTLGEDDLPHIFESFWRGGGKCGKHPRQRAGALYLPTAHAQDERRDFCEDRR